MAVWGLLVGLGCGNGPLPTAVEQSLGQASSGKGNQRPRHDPGECRGLVAAVDDVRSRLLLIAHIPSVARRSEQGKGMPRARSGRRQAGELVAAAGFEALQFHQRSLDVRASGFKVGPAGIELAQDVLQLRALAPRGVIQIDDG